MDRVSEAGQPESPAGQPGKADRNAAARSDDADFAIAAARIARDNKAEDILVLDLRGVSPVCDYFVICTGTSDRQMRAVADQIDQFAKRLNRRPLGRAGYEQARWVLIDFVTVVVHIFDLECRRYYDLELLWGDVPRVDWQTARPAARQR